MSDRINNETFMMKSNPRKIYIESEEEVNIPLRRNLKKRKNTNNLESPVKKRKNFKKLKYCTKIFQVLISIFENDPLDFDLMESMKESEKQIIYLILNNKFNINNIHDKDSFSKYFDTNGRFILTTIYSKNNKTKLLHRLFKKIKHPKLKLSDKGKRMTYSEFIKEKEHVRILCSLMGNNKRNKKKNIFTIIRSLIEPNFHKKLRNIEKKFFDIHSDIKTSDQSLQLMFYTKFLEDLKDNKSDPKNYKNKKDILFKNFNNLPILISDVKALHYDLQTLLDN
jgi:hypothetical protein